jgi:hypothetical protein
LIVLVFSHVGFLNLQAFLWNKHAAILSHQLRAKLIIVV